MPRIVTAETLDGLQPSDPEAIRSRQDLQRIHRVMGTRARLARVVAQVAAARSEASVLRILELGAGDGTLMLGVARRAPPVKPRVLLTLLDRQDLVKPDTLTQYANAGWEATSVVADVFDWAAQQRATAEGPPVWDLIVMNLFLHHFEGVQLRALISAAAASSECVFACEPRRARLALAGSHLVGFIGANAVTRNDAILSVHAGFRAREISACWPADAAEWDLQEYPAGLFSHCFSAARHAARAKLN